MAPAFWFTVQVGHRRIPIPIGLFLPFALALDLVALVALSLYGVWKRAPVLLRIGVSFFLSRLTLALLLHGGQFKICVRDKGDPVRIHGGWNS